MSNLFLIVGLIISGLLVVSTYLFYRLKLAGFLLSNLNADLEKQRVDTHEVSEQFKLHARDEVTDLPAWVLFEDRVRHTMAECARSQQQLMAGILMIEINDFGLIVEGLAADESRELLKAIGQRLELVLRKVDIVSRYQQSSFAILATQLNRAETAAIVAQRVLHELGQPFYTSKREIYLTVSIGIAIYPADGADLPALIQAAQTAANVASENGNHVYQYYQEKNQVQSHRELMLHLNLKRETVFQELALFYQPVMDVKKKSVVCMEVCLKWQHTSLGLIETAELYYHIDRRRKQNEFTEWVLKAACRQFVQWRQAGLPLEKLGVPVSIRQLESTPFIYHLSQIMQGCQFKPEWLLLELKDTDVDVSFDILEKAFNMLNYLGVNFAISQSGTTAFSLAYLRSIKCALLMLPAWFVDDVDTNPLTLSVIKGMLALTKALGCELVVRGVETEKQYVLLSQAGCEVMQGGFLAGALQDGDVQMKMPTLL